MVITYQCDIWIKIFWKFKKIFIIKQSHSLFFFFFLSNFNFF